MEEVKDINKAWQLCVVDRQRVDFIKAPNFMKLVSDDAIASTIKDGTAIFVVNTIVKPFSSLPSKFQELASYSGYSIPQGVTFANIWNPSSGKYGWIIQDFLHPILTEQDIIEMETKFGISLKNFL